MEIIKKLFGKKEVLYRNPLMGGDLRNEPCVCNSGRKLKHCHGNKYAITKKEMNEIQLLIQAAMTVAKL